MRQEAGDKMPEPHAAHIRIRRVLFKDANGKPLRPDRRFIVALRKFQWDERDNWTDELQQRVTDEWRHRGYFQALSEVSSRLLRSSAEEKDYEVTIVIEPGGQYRLDQIVFMHNSHFDAVYLRSLFPILTAD